MELSLLGSRNFSAQIFLVALEDTWAINKASLDVNIWNSSTSVPDSGTTTKPSCPVNLTLVPKTLSSFTLNPPSLNKGKYPAAPPAALATIRHVLFVASNPETYRLFVLTPRKTYPHAIPKMKIIGRRKLMREIGGPS
jgi:hypothetical protein